MIKNDFDSVDGLLRVLHKMNQDMDSITKNKYGACKSYILKNPNDYHNVFYDVFDSILFAESSEFKLTLLPGKELYRARVIDLKEIAKSKNADPTNGLSVDISNGSFITKGYDEKNSIESPIGIAGVGRNNIQGMPYLYLAEDIPTACAEMKSDLRKLISVATFEVEKELKLIDLNIEKPFDKEPESQYGINPRTFFILLMKDFSVPVSAEDYRFTQIISDYIRKSGVDGIAYRSFRTGSTNYTIFNSHRSDIKYLDSRILLHYSSTSVFWDFNEKKATKAGSSEDSFYDEKIAEGILRNISDYLKEPYIE